MNQREPQPSVHVNTVGSLMGYYQRQARVNSSLTRLPEKWNWAKTTSPVAD